jgi:phage terminase large subunit GpA-like protein
MKRAKRKPVTLSQWIETNIVLPDVVAVPGPLVLAPYMREIADAIGDPAVERVSVLKSARIGFCTVLTAAIAYHVVKDQCISASRRPSSTRWLRTAGRHVRDLLTAGRVGCPRT